MKNNWHRFIAFSVFIFFVLGCSALSKIQKAVEKTQSPQVFTSSDGTCQITVPGSWRTETVLNTEATIQASNRLSEQYLVVIRESKKDFGTRANLDLVTSVIRDQLEKSVSGTVFSPNVPIIINGYPAKQFEVSGEVDNIQAKYIYAIVETPGNYYQLITWSLASRFDGNRSQLLDAINSFKEIAAEGPPVKMPTKK